MFGVPMTRKRRPNVERTKATSFPDTTERADIVLRMPCVPAASSTRPPILKRVRSALSTCPRTEGRLRGPIPGTLGITRPDAQPIVTSVTAPPSCRATVPSRSRGPSSSVGILGPRSIPGENSSTGILGPTISSGQRSENSATGIRGPSSPSPNAPICPHHESASSSA